MPSDRVTELFDKLLVELGAQTARENRPFQATFLANFTNLVRVLARQWEHFRARNTLGEVSDADQAG